MNTATATSTYRSLAVTIDERGIVRAANGALLGDREGMERLGWEFSDTATEPSPAPATRSTTGVVVWPADLTASNNRLVRRGWQASIIPRAAMGGTDDDAARAAILQRCPHSHKTTDAATACGRKMWDKLPA